MHSRIYQISKEPITSDKLIPESRYDNYFVPGTADYVVLVEKQDSIKSDLEWLTTCKKGIEIKTENGITTMTIKSKEEYFEKNFEEFKSTLEKLQDYNLEDFMNVNKWLDMYRLQDSYEDKHGFYVDDNDEYFGTTTFDNFMRSVENGDVYYIGNIFDYHF